MLLFTIFCVLARIAQNKRAAILAEKEATLKKMMEQLVVIMF